ncbi:MAG: DUF2782 domain-containing protein [Burkholderiales bacterium]|jgi:hypothetical protein|nr:DUF2782 domain-containing protein [Burkholderiales bacterium]
MPANRSLAIALALWCALSSCAFAQGTTTAKEPSKAPGVEPSNEKVASNGEPKVQYTVIEDDSTRIEELKVRGQTQRITVSPKGMKSYEILPATEGRDMSDSAGSQRGAAGKRVWRIFNF